MFQDLGLHTRVGWIFNSGGRNLHILTGQDEEKDWEDCGAQVQRFHLKPFADSKGSMLTLIAVGDWQPRSSSIDSSFTTTLQGSLVNLKWHSWHGIQSPPLNLGWLACAYCSIFSFTRKVSMCLVMLGQRSEYLGLKVRGPGSGTS